MWSCDAKFFCKDHEKALWIVWFFVLHIKCKLEGGINRECIHESFSNIKSQMKCITDWLDEDKESKSNLKLVIDLKYYNKLVSSINNQVRISLGSLTYF